VPFCANLIDWLSKEKIEPVKAIPCYRFAHLMPYLEFMGNCGVPVEKRLLQFKLPSQIQGESNLYLPQFPTFTFLRKVQHDEGIDEMSYRAMKHLRFTDLDEQFVSNALQSPTLLSALKIFSRDVAIEDPDVRFWIEFGEINVKLCMTNLLPLDPESLCFEDWAELLVLIAIVQAFIGFSWIPEEMAFRSNLPLGQYISEEYPNTHLLVGQSANWISLPRRLLSSPPLKSDKQDTSKSLDALFNRQTLRENQTEPFIASLKKILPAYFKDGYPSVTHIANMTGTSTRSLQRKLKQTGYNYTELVQTIRFEFAADLLTHTDTKVSTIAYQLDYNDSAHFSRAFHRLTGISPTQYRQFHRA